MHLPVGFDRDEDDEIVLCADEQVRHAIERVFVLWRRAGSARQVVGELIARAAAAAPLGRRAARPLGSRELWRGARLLTNPVICRRVRVRPPPPGEDASTRPARCASATSRCRSRSGLSACPITIPAMSPGTEYLANRQRLRANVRPRGEGGGAAREGGALLQGLLRCGRCGRRMQVAYSGTGRPQRPRYACVRGSLCTAPRRPARPSAAAGWRRPSSTRSSKPSRRPAWPRAPARSPS